MLLSTWMPPDAGLSVKFLTIFLAVMVFRAAALTQGLCSTFNTGADTSAVTDLYQSNGACQTTCNGYAFAVVQAQSCWCSNYAPADTTSTSDCSESCPGYPDENCGSTSSGLFGYVALGKAPSGTTGASPSTSSMEATPTSTTVDPVQAVSTQPLPTVLFGTTLALEATSSFSSSTISVLRAPLPSVGISAAIPLAAISYRTHVLTPSLQTFTPDPVSVTVLETVTESPSVQISLVSITPSTTSTSITTTSVPFTRTTPTLIPVSITLDPITSSPTTLKTSSTPTSAPPTTTPTTSKSSTTSSSSSWSATPYTSVVTVTGQVKTLTLTPTVPPAATTTVVTAIPDRDGGFFSNSGKVAGTFVPVAFIILLLAAAGIWFCLRRSRRRQAEAVVAPSIVGGSTPQRRPSRLSQMGLIGGTVGSTHGEKTVPRIETSGWGPGNGAEKSPADTLSAVDQRGSYPRIVDQRLEPTALWNPLHDNGSHVSVRSFRDDQDYSRRMLRIANPDD